jgi:hypothetical protein
MKVASKGSSVEDVWNYGARRTRLRLPRVTTNIRHVTRRSRLRFKVEDVIGSGSRLPSQDRGTRNFISFANRLRNKLIIPFWTRTCA